MLVAGAVSLIFIFSQYTNLFFKIAVISLDVAVYLGFVLLYKVKNDKYYKLFFVCLIAGNIFIMAFINIEKKELKDNI